MKVDIAVLTEAYLLLLFVTTTTSGCNMHMKECQVLAFYIEGLFLLGDIEREYCVN
jgi:hypothetical protein